jgi:REP element-mobilizing transposase RayT
METPQAITGTLHLNERGYRALRRYRYSVPGTAYLVTSVVDGRRPLFADFDTACRVARCMGGGGKLLDSRVMAWVLMPDHAHWLVQLGRGLALPATVQRLKSLTARAAGTESGQVWQAGYHERCLRGEREWRPAARYLVRNPVRAGLCVSVWDYPFWNAEWLDERSGGGDPVA